MTKRNKMSRGLYFQLERILHVPISLQVNGEITRRFFTFLLETKNFLKRENITFDCEALDSRNCEQNYQKYRDLAEPESVYERSLSK